MRKGISVGLFLMVLGATLFLGSFVKTNADIVIDVTLTVGPGSKHMPQDEPQTYYHTRVLSESSLRGEIFVEGGGIYLAAIGYDTQGLEDVCVEGHYSFKIDPADDLYAFTFDNTQGVTESVIRFILIEEWTPMAAVLRFFGICLLSPIDLMLVAITCLRSEKKL